MKKFFKTLGDAESVIGDHYWSKSEGVELVRFMNRKEKQQIRYLLELYLSQEYKKCVEIWKNKFFNESEEHLVRPFKLIE